MKVYFNIFFAGLGAYLLARFGEVDTEFCAAFIMLFMIYEALDRKIDPSKSTERNDDKNDPQDGVRAGEAKDRRPEHQVPTQQQA